MEIVLYAALAIVGVVAAGFALVPSLVGSNRADKRIKALQGDIQANRRTADVAQAAGLEILKVEKSLMGIINLIACRV